MPSTLTRRGALGALLAAPAALAGGSASALTPAGAAISAVRVDVGPLRALGAAREAARLAQVLPAAFAASFGPALAPSRGGTTLVATVREVFLQSYVGDDGLFGGGSQNDFLLGQATLLGPRGEVIASERVQVSNPASSGGAWYIEGSEIRRIDQLGRNFAYWSRRQLGL